MLLTIAAVLIDRLWLRRTPERRLVAAVAKSNRIMIERAAIEQQVSENQAELIRLTYTQGPQLVDALAKLLDGDIGGRVAFGLQAPHWSGHLRNSARYRS